MPIIQTRTTYLEMFRPPIDVLAPPHTDVHITRADSPSTESYRMIYRSVGAELFWVDRLTMPDGQLHAILSDERVDVFVLRVAGEVAGYSELDRRADSEIELAYFGLFPRFIGQGLGSYLLNWTLHTAWSHHPTRVSVHTCDLDHPAALPTYLKAGFQISDQRTIPQPVPEPP